MALPIEPLRSILQLEQRRQYADATVIGGLDAYLQQWLAQGRSTGLRPAFLKRLAQLGLTEPRYASWDAERRRQWVREVLDWLEAGQPEAPEENGAASAPHAASSRRKPSRRPAAGNAVPSATAEALDASLATLKGFTPAICSKLSRFGVKTVRDLLYFFPRRHVDYTQRQFIADLKEGLEQTIIAHVWETRVIMPGGRRSAEAVVGDETGNMRIVWFNQPYLVNTLRTNSRIAVSGRVTVFKGQKVFESPEWEILGQDDQNTVHTGRLVPVYPLTQGLYPRQLRRLVKGVVEERSSLLLDFMPQDLRERCQLQRLEVAVRQAHFPDSADDFYAARRRLAFDELFLFQLGVLGRKREWQESQPGNALTVDPGLVDRLAGSLPFTLTSAQKRALQEILLDLQKPRAMSRLLQGEVGSGKTAVAVIALMVAVANGYQCAFMAPTEILADQHFRSLSHLLGLISHGREEEDDVHSYVTFLERPVTVARLVGSLSTREKSALHNLARRGELDIAVGTHALVQGEVEFHKLGLIVVDEQHRFGVAQRSALRQKGFNPHVLAMTATPIPRTMALTLYGDLDLSTLNELPPGRQTVRTRWVYPHEREKAYDFVRRQAQAGRQIFIICPLVEESEATEARAAVAEYQRLSQEVFPDLKLGLLHGRMKSDEKEEVMSAYRRGELQILVSTAVVEVGIDVPNATVMLVEGADRFGLSQLHQLRGRVGRGQHASYCLLLAEDPSPEAQQRLRLIERTHDGFALAEEDLKMRGPGEFFGTRQSGVADFRMAKLSDVALLELARREAIALFEDREALRSEKYGPLVQELRRVWPNAAEWS